MTKFIQCILILYFVGCINSVKIMSAIDWEPTGCECAPVVQYQADSNNNTNQSNSNNYTSQSDSNNYTSQSDSNFTNQSSNRIMGGFEVLPNKLPYQVLIKSYVNNGINLGICGGTIINKLYILTAGHCFFNKSGDHVELFDVDKTFVLVGKHSFHGVSDSQFLKVSEFIRYTGDIEHIDMGLIKLKEPLQFSSTIMPACLPTKRNELYTGEMGLVSGMGFGNKNGELKGAKLQILNNKNCTSKTKDVSVICTLGPGNAVCFGDSGSPLTVNESGQHVVVGVVTAGHCHTQMQSYFTRVSTYMDWLRPLIKDGDCPKE